MTMASCIGRRFKPLSLLAGGVLGIFIGCSMTWLMLASDCSSCIKAAKRNVLADSHVIVDAKDFMSPTVSTSLSTDSYTNTDKQKSTSTPSTDDSNLFTVLLPSDESSLDSISTAALTWGRTVSRLLIFVNKDTPSIDVPPEVQVHKLFDSLVNNHPTTTELLQVLQYLYDYHLNDSKWFLFSSEKLYINMASFNDLINSIPEDTVYIGSSIVTVSKSITYCTSDGGILLSQEALVKIVTQISICRKLQSLYSWDKGLGRCVSETIGSQCQSDLNQFYNLKWSSLTDSFADFVHSNSVLFDSTFSIYPLVSTDQFYTLYYYYSSMEYMKLSYKMDTLYKHILDACQQLPDAIAGKLEIVEGGCGLIKPEDEEIKSNQLIKHRPASRYRPTNQYHYRSWNYFDSSKIYLDDTIEPLKHTGLYKFYSRELKRATQEAAIAINKKYSPKRMKFRSLQNGYVKHNPLVGNEYIIDAKYAEINHPSNSFIDRVRLLQPLQTGFVVKPSKENKEEKINVVVPVYGVTERCSEFLNMYENTVLKSDFTELIHLVFVTFGEQDIEKVKSKVTPLLQMYPKAEITIVRGEGNFSRARALDQGMMTLNNEDLVFFCDVDMEIHQNFFTRCRRNAIRGKMVYYPEVFKMYHPKFVGGHKNDAKKKISRSKGHWGSYAFGMLCIYKSDYVKIGGLNTKMMGWGGEDVDFFEKVLRSKIEILRAPDIGLIHKWHPRKCPRHKLTDSNFKQCLSSRAEALADRRQLAYYLYDLAEKNPELL